jgi:hypothetical protein
VHTAPVVEMGSGEAGDDPIWGYKGEAFLVIAGGELEEARCLHVACFCLVWTTRNLRPLNRGMPSCAQSFWNLARRLAALTPTF